MLRSLDIAKKLKQIVIDNYNEYKNNDNLSLNNNTKLIPSDNKDKALKLTWTLKPSPL